MLNVEELQAFYGKSRIVDGISFAIEAGEIVGLLGRNGAGKTTTLRALAGLVSAKARRLDFDGMPLLGLPSHHISRLGLVLVPDYRGVMQSLTVEENLAIAERRGTDFTLEDAYRLFPRLKQRRSNSGAALSGGEQQMVAIARGLMCKPKVLMLDEPTQGLAPVIVDEIVDALKAIRDRGNGLSILIVDQNLDVCLSLAGRHYVMEQGLIAHRASSEEIAANGDLQKRYLGVDAA